MRPSSPPWARASPGCRVSRSTEQIEFAQRIGIRHPVIADPQLRLRDALSLPTFELNGVTYLCRLTLVAERGTIVKAFYPVFPPDRHAAEVLAWLRERGPR